MALSTKAEISMPTQPILVVDDQPDFCLLIQRTLESQGYLVSAANTLQEANRLICSQAFDTVITDICFENGEQDGLRLLQKSLELQPDTPVILITGMPSVTTASTAVRLNAFDYLPKPISLSKLAQSVAQAVEYKAELVQKRQTEIENHKYQRRAEEKIRRQNAFLVNVIESLAHPFMVVDVSDYTIKIANSAAKRRRSVDAMTCYRLNHGYDVPCHEKGLRCALQEVVETRQPVRLEHFHLDSDGNQSEFEVHAFPLLEKNGRVSQVIQYYIDITEKKRLESIAEAANLMDNLGYIFSGIRHEIGNPINSVKMALSVLAMNLDRYPQATIREFVDRGLEELARVEYLLKALKNFSMFEVPVVESTLICRFMANFMKLVEGDFIEKGIRIHLEALDEDIRALIDHRAFHQVMLNLLINSADAVQACKEPCITISINQVNAKRVQVCVGDNGCGMSDAERDNLFRPFFTSKPHGTGLGLVIIKKLLARMDSSIMISSSPGKGTTVIMNLPLGRVTDEPNRKKHTDN